MRITVVAALVLCVCPYALFAQANRPGPEQTADATGTWVLVDVAGHALPYTPVHDGAPAAVQILSSRLTLKADSTFASSMTYRTLADTTKPPFSREFTGRWSTLAPDCVATGTGTVNVTNQGLPTQVAYLQDAEITCPGGARLIADQAIVTDAAGRIELVGNVRYSDPDRALTAERAEYDKVHQRIHASGNVVVRDVKAGSTILTANEINFSRAGGTEYLLSWDNAGKTPARLEDEFFSFDNEGMILRFKRQVEPAK